MGLDPRNSHRRSHRRGLDCSGVLERINIILEAHILFKKFQEDSQWARMGLFEEEANEEFEIVQNAQKGRNMGS